MAHAFVGSVDRHGRNHEPELVALYYLRTNPFKIIGQIPIGFKLWRRGRMPILPHNIEGLNSLRKMMAAIEENGTK